VFIECLYQQTLIL